MTLVIDLEQKLQSYPEDECRLKAFKICKKILKSFDGSEFKKLERFTHDWLAFPNQREADEFAKMLDESDKHYQSIYSGMEAPTANVLAYSCYGELLFTKDSKKSALNGLIFALRAGAMLKAESDEENYDSVYDKTLDSLVLASLEDL